MALSRELREYAETPDRFSDVVPGASVERYMDERVCIVQGPTWAGISGVHVAPGEVESLLAEVRARVPADRHPVWWIGPSSEPPDLAERLRALGLTDPVDRATELRAVALAHEPESPRDVEVARIETFEQFAAARELQMEVFDAPDERRARNRERFRSDFEESQRLGIPVGFVAAVDGRPAATGHAIPSSRGVFLVGGATAPWARGRGIYRALVRARWDFAVARGTPALIVQAIPRTSYPILVRLGFEDVATIRRLEDPGAGG